MNLKFFRVCFLLSCVEKSYFILYPDTRHTLLRCPWAVGIARGPVEGVSKARPLVGGMYFDFIWGGSSIRLCQEYIFKTLSLSLYPLERVEK